MKKTLTALFALLSISALAHDIEGIMVLKGSLKSEIKINRMKTTCRVKIADVKNLMEEDQYGNPAYKLKVEISLKSGGFFSVNEKNIKYDKTLMMNNLFTDGVRDLEYQGGGVKLMVTKSGRLDKVIFPFQNQSITCKF